MKHTKREFQNIENEIMLDLNLSFIKEKRTGKKNYNGVSFFGTNKIQKHAALFLFVQYIP